MEIILKCCEQPFAVQKMELFRETWVLGANVDERVRFCPFCGRNLIPAALDAGDLPAPQSDSQPEVLSTAEPGTQPVLRK